MPAAEASLCAADQGLFWPMHDRIFATLEQWSPMPDVRDHFKKLATQVEVDTKAFNECFDGRKNAQRVDADYRAAVEAGARGTPYFVIGNQTISGAQPFAAFDAAIKAQLP